MGQFIKKVLLKAAGFRWNEELGAWTSSKVAGLSLGAAGALSALSQVFGISAVLHSSGGLILTGSSGYIAGTFLAPFVAFFAWAIWPALVVVGLLALFWKWTAVPFVWVKQILNRCAGWLHRVTSEKMD
jgi:hypothetical protein